jgi:uncharacterized integral membrane protein
MKTLRRLLVILVLIALVTALFQNQESLGASIAFSFLKWHFSLVLGFWLLFAFIAGALLFAVFDAWRSLSRGLRNRKKDRETEGRIEALRAEVERLKSGRENLDGAGPR